MCTALRYIVTGAILLVPACQGQSLSGQVDSKSVQVGGVHLYEVSVFTGYFSSAYALTAGAGFGQVTTPGLALGAEVNYGASATLGLQRHRERSNFSITYSGSYNGMVRYSALDAFNHSVSLSANRTLGHNWTASLSGTGQDSTLAQSLFQPSAFSVVSQLPASFDNLAAAFSIGQFSDAQIAAMLTGSPLLETPARSLLLGDRILSYSVLASLDYARSSRLSFHFGSFAAGGQHLAGANQPAVPQNYVMPHSIGMDGSVGMSYALSPRTQWGIEFGGNRIVNRYQTSNIGTATSSLGRKMGEHWFMRAYGGGSFAELTQQKYGAPRTRQFIGGGSVGFRMYANTLLGSYDRSSFDQYGFAVGTTTTLLGSWTWHRPGSGWGLFSSFGQQQIRNTGFASISGWQASTGWSKSLNSQMKLTAQYVYLSSAGNYLGVPTNLSVHSVRVSLDWVPQEIRR
jgi:hypothetical protein